MSLAYADFFAGSCHEVIILRDIGYDEQGNVLLLRRGRDECVRDKLVFAIISRLLENFASGALLKRFVLVDLASGKSPRSVGFPSLDEDALMTNK